MLTVLTAVIPAYTSGFMKNSRSVMLNIKRQPMSANLHNRNMLIYAVTEYAGS